MTERFTGIIDKDPYTPSLFYDNSKGETDAECFLEDDEILVLLNELNNENKQLKKLITLIADAETYTKEESVKEILRHEIWGIDSVAGESFNAWNEYVILSDFFKKHYGEHWDNNTLD